MATAGPTLCMTGDDDGGGLNGGDLPWTDPSNITADDATNATAILVAQTTNCLVAKDFRFSPTIPSGATINGIVATIKRRALAGTVDTEFAVIQSDGVAVSSNLSDGVSWNSSYEVVTLGSSTNNWNYAGTSEALNDASTGIAFQAVGTGTAAVDYVKMTVYYTSITGKRSKATGLGTKLGARQAFTGD